MYIWRVADTCNGEIFEDVFESFNFELACYFIKINCHNKKFERLVLYCEKI